MLLSLWTNYWDLWEEYHKVTFDGANRLILINNGVEDINIKQDLYSDWKEWVLMIDNSKWAPAFSVIGGEALPGNKALGTTYFLINGWRIKPYEGNHALRVEGNIYTEEGDSPFINTFGDYRIRIESTVSSLVDSNFTQLAEIEYAAFEGGVTIDQLNGVSGDVYPRGTFRMPVNNWTDAVNIARKRGLNKYYCKGTTILDNNADLGGSIIVGQGALTTNLIVSSYANTDNAIIKEATVTGYLGNNILLEKSVLSNVELQNTAVFECIFTSGTISFKEGTSGAINILNSATGTPGSPTVFDFTNTEISLSMRNYAGGISLRNKTDSSISVIDLNSGRIFIEDSVTDGLFYIRGVGRVFDNSTGSAVVDRSYLLEADVLQGIKTKVDSLKNPTLIIDGEIII